MLVWERAVDFAEVLYFYVISWWWDYEPIDCGWLLIVVVFVLLNCDYFLMIVYCYIVLLALLLMLGCALIG